MTRQELTKLLDLKSISWMPTGSRYICDPPPMDTDEDYIALMIRGMDAALELAGFIMNTDPELYEEMPSFYAYRLGEFNVVVTYDKDFYVKFCEATNQAKSQNIMAKSDRIAMFQNVLYGNANEEIPY